MGEKTAPSSGLGPRRKLGGDIGDLALIRGVSLCRRVGQTRTGVIRVGLVTSEDISSSSSALLYPPPSLVEEKALGSKERFRNSGFREVEGS